MSIQKFDDNCRGCQPVIVDMSGRVVPDNEEPMVSILKEWESTTRKEREAWHRFTCHNSRAPQDLVIIEDLQKRFQAACM